MFLALCNVLSRQLPEVTEKKNYGNPHTRYSVSQSQFVAGTYRQSDGYPHTELVTYRHVNFCTG